MARIGLISDTHGLVRPEALEALRGVDLIMHAGDVCGKQVLDELAAIAPVRAVRGNMDGGAWPYPLPETDAVDLEGHILYMLHDIGDLDLDPAEAEISVVIFGHSHMPLVERRYGVLYVNPGSAGPVRAHKPVSVAILELSDDAVEAEILELQVG